MGELEALVLATFQAEIAFDVDWSTDTSFASLGVDSLQLFTLVALAEDLADSEFPSALLDQVESIRELVDWTVVALEQRSDSSHPSIGG